MEFSDFDYHVNPSSDGYDHIRIHPHGMTILGRLLCHAARTPFIHPEHGRFGSMEAYWQWVRTGRRHEGLRDSYGYKAFSLGMRHDTVPFAGFRQLIMEGISCKVHQTARIKDLMVLSDIPFLMYTRDPDFDDFVIDHANDWCLESLTTVRRCLLEQNPQPQRFAFKMPQILEESLSGHYKFPLNA